MGASAPPPAPPPTGEGSDRRRLAPPSPDRTSAFADRGQRRAAAAPRLWAPAMSSDAIREGQQRRRRLAMALLPVVVFAAVAGLFFVTLNSDRDPSQLPSVLIDRPVPRFDLPPVEGLTHQGRPVPGLNSADLAAGEVTLVNIWASWCGPCIQEHPILVWLKEQHELRLVGINYKDAPDKALQFLARLGDPYDLLGVDRDGRAAIDWGVYGVPETFVVDGRGEILYRYAGPLSERVVREELLPAVEIARERTRSAAAKAL